MRTVIIGIGLDNKFISPDVAFLSHKENVGKREVSRLLGKGKRYGHGPVPTFFRQASISRDQGNAIDRIIISRPRRDRQSDPDEPNETIDETDFVDTLKPWVRDAELVILDEDCALWGGLCNAIREVSGAEPTELHGQTDVRFLVVGCHTENRVLAIASFLRNVLGASDVAVSAHLAGSSSIEAHYAALRHNLPGCSVRVLLDLEEAARFAGLPAEAFADFSCHTCMIGPDDACAAMSSEQRRIIENLGLHWSRMQLRPLQGGFSGSLLFLAEGWKGQARTEPVVLKIDQFAQMRRELDGYHQVKDFFGKNVPTFSHPVAQGDSVGVAMEFAAMEGQPETLQGSFEAAEDAESFRVFRRRLEKCLSLLTDKLYRNTRHLSWVSPYRTFDLHSEHQKNFLRQNIELIESYCAEIELPHEAAFNPEIIQSMFRLLSANEDGIESEVCLVHGDLNLQNIISDSVDNIWFIDWTHSGEYPVELDFAKIENDIKFVLSNEFDIDDLPRLKAFEEYLLAERMPAMVNDLPAHLRHVKWDLRYRRILESVRLVREVCFSLKESDDWLVYQIALLRYATHTMSFDQRRDRGECELPQLLHALYSVESLAFNLVAHDFQLRIRGERPAVYPTRQRISIDYAPWTVDCDEYDPPYFVHDSVKANDTAIVPGGWADPEDFTAIIELDRFKDVKHRDAGGRPLNPRGRTGLAGRGLLGRWGANLTTVAVAFRVSDGGENVDVLLGTKEMNEKLWLPKSFVREGEDGAAAMWRILKAEAGWSPDTCDATHLLDGYFYDSRQTDHAWVEVHAFLSLSDFSSAPHDFQPGGDFEEIRWMPVEAKTINRMPSAEAQFIREAVRLIERDNVISEAAANRVLTRTG
jgi:ADP-ribose pyrophosphatase